MKLRFYIEYITQAEEMVCINIQKADGQLQKHRMVSADGQSWRLDLDVECAAEGLAGYWYSVERRRGEVRREWPQRLHQLPPKASAMDVCSLLDIWYDRPDDSFLFSSAFTKCLYRRQRKPLPRQRCRRRVYFKVCAPQLNGNERLRIVGNDEVLGAWNTERSLEMYETNPCEWVAVVDASRLKSDPVEYKFLIVSDDPSHDVIWEEGLNHQLKKPALEAGEALMCESHRAWFDVPSPHFAGTAVPISALRSEGSWGVGDFGDLRMMVDWLAVSGQNMLQLMPINDTTLTGSSDDSNPLSPTSVFALNPIFCDMRQLPPLRDASLAADFEARRLGLNEKKTLDYSAVSTLKEEYLRAVYEQEGRAVLSSAKFKAWLQSEEQWLLPYAWWRVLLDRYATWDPAKWKEDACWHESRRSVLLNPRSKEYRLAAYHYLVQYVLTTQMAEVHEYARRKRVVLKGEVPVSVSRFGVDVWASPQYFCLDVQAGEPAGASSAKGMNWGFPTYDWETMMADGGLWWKARMRRMQEFFDAFRLDGVMGYFRMWEIPEHGVQGLLGHYQPALGYTVSEMARYGLEWDAEALLRPYVSDEILGWWCPEKADYVKATFLDSLGDDVYRFKPEYDSQRKLEAFFRNRLDLESMNLRDTLLALLSNVLFVPDRLRAGVYHPRVAAQLDPCYDALWYKEKEAFNRLYDDYFYRRNNYLWFVEAVKKLGVITQATQMLPCADGVSEMPDFVAEALDELQILRLEMLQGVPFHGARFTDITRAMYRSVAAISSFDTPTMRMWWDEDADRTHEFYRFVLLRGDAPPHPLPSWLAHDVVLRNLKSPSIFCIQTVQDWLALDPYLRISDANDERTVGKAGQKSLWRYRMHVTLEQLMASVAFTSSLHGMLKECMR